SRRRHTRSTRDWSSDVCSSDLGENLGEHVRAGAGEFERVRSQRAGEFEITRQIERAFCDLTGHDPRGLASVCETLIFAKLFDIEIGRASCRGACASGVIRGLRL